MFFRDTGPVPETLRSLHARLEQAGLQHILMGAMALQAYGIRRTTEDVDICMRREDLERFRSQFVGAPYQIVAGRTRRFFDPTTQVTIDILVAGEVAGRRDRQREILFPDPSEGSLFEGLLVPSLARQIELKLVTWRYQDWADVVQLIRTNQLDESFADQLRTIVRAAYLQCVDQRGEEDRYSPEQ